MSRATTSVDAGRCLAVTRSTWCTRTTLAAATARATVHARATRSHGSPVASLGATQSLCPPSMRATLHEAMRARALRASTEFPYLAARRAKGPVAVVTAKACAPRPRCAPIGCVPAHHLQRFRIGQSRAQIADQPPPPSPDPRWNSFRRQNCVSLVQACAGAAGVGERRRCARAGQTWVRLGGCA